jgi:hypothetical protein
VANIANSTTNKLTSAMSIGTQQSTNTSQQVIDDTLPTDQNINLNFNPTSAVDRDDQRAAIALLEAQ